MLPRLPLILPSFVPVILEIPAMTRQGDRGGPLDQYGYTSDYAGRRLEDTPDALNAPRQQAGRARKGRNQTGKEMISCSNL